MTRRSPAAGEEADANPKPGPQLGSITHKEPDDQGADDEPMSGAQASYLKTLSEQALEPEAFDPAITKAEASLRIGALRAKLKLQDGPPHTL